MIKRYEHMYELRTYTGKIASGI